MASNSAVRFDTSDYARSHGRSPRGHGSWAFFRAAHCDVNREDPIWVHGATYGDARRAAAERAKGEGVGRLFVGA